MIEMLLKGGILLYPIGACSVVALSVFLERMFSLQRGRILPQAFAQRIEELVRTSRIDDALLLCEEAKTPIATIMAAALRHASFERKRIREAVEEVGKVEGASLERYVEVVGTCSAISPLLGLLGTVLGMIRVFQGVVEHGLGDPAVFASGIWEALVTTAVGLAVAIPAYIFYKILQGRVDDLLVQLEMRAAHIVDLLSEPAS